MLLELKDSIIYGPVRSRRIGISLGVNILPPGIKTCTFNCLYCQYGWADTNKIKTIDKKFFPSANMVVDAVENTLETLASPPAYITFSGNGEPTLHPFLRDVVDGITGLRDRLNIPSKTAILSNSSVIHHQSIREILSRLDTRIMKLDAGNEEVFESFNMPDREIMFENIVEGLKVMENVIIQSLFTSGPSGNSTVKAISDWIEKIKYISPQFVQIYTLARDCPSKSISPSEKKDLLSIKTLLTKENIPAEVY